MMAEGKIQRSHFKCFYCDQEGQDELSKEQSTDQSSEAATTAMMAVDEGDFLLAASSDGESDGFSDSGNAYHHARDLFGWLTTRLLAKDSPVPQTGDP